MSGSVGFVVRRTAGSGVLLAIALVALAEGLPDRPAAPAPSFSPLSYKATLMQVGSQEVLAKPIALVDVEAPPSPGPALSAARSVRTRPQISMGGATLAKTRAVRRYPFPYGQCTWYVSHRRYVPWSGNAWQWWWNAALYGFRRGWKPRPGAIMVAWSFPWGHVAYVERVYGDGSFLVSEMNWWGVRGGGWGRVDYRVIRSKRGIIGFIY